MERKVIDYFDLFTFLRGQKQAYHSLSLNRTGDNEKVYKIKEEVIDDLIKVIKSDYFNTVQTYKKHYYKQD